MISSRRPPTLMPGMPCSQPGITLPVLSGIVNGRCGSTRSRTLAGLVEDADVVDRDRRRPWRWRRSRDRGPWSRASSARARRDRDLRLLRERRRRLAWWCFGVRGPARAARALRRAAVELAAGASPTAGRSRRAPATGTSIESFCHGRWACDSFRRTANNPGSVTAVHRRRPVAGCRGHRAIRSRMAALDVEVGVHALTSSFSSSASISLSASRRRPLERHPGLRPLRHVGALDLDARLPIASRDRAKSDGSVTIS